MNPPLKVLFIWHHHQPYYKTDGTFLMPWVRMHGIKDYWDMVRILDDYPNIKQTFNFAPSLLEQIRDYLDGSATDEAYILSRKNPEMFSQANKLSALKIFFLANQDRMIRRYPRYSELLAKRGSIRSESDLHSARDRFSPQDFRDLQVWWNLAWVGEYSRFDPPFKSYLDKQRNFTEAEKQRLLAAQMEIMGRIIPHHKKAVKRGQIEISVSPFYHPILPLLCDSSVATLANPHALLPEARFRYPADAEHQIKTALDYGKNVFGSRPAGMWPSEGSVSDAALKLMAANHVSWVATDEAILHKTLAKAGKISSESFLEKYFPYSFDAGNGNVRIFFRDHDLSDKIGFVYSGQSPDDAAHDFMTHLIGIRASIADTYGAKGLEAAVVPVILDGENAWEFYQSDGKDFLRTLYHLLSNESRVETVLPSGIRVKKGNTLKHIEPGSWINGNFDIWIGQEEDNRAWKLLYEARKALDRNSRTLSPKRRAQALREVAVAEGSDWCWWYGDEHKSVQAAEFDELFRYHLKQIYISMGVRPPASLDEPIKRRVEMLSYRQPVRAVSPDIKSGRAVDEWKNAGYVEQEQPTGAMQKTGVQIKRVSFGNDRNALYLMIETTGQVHSLKIVAEFFSPVRITIEIGDVVSFRREKAGDAVGCSLEYAREGNTLRVRISCDEVKSGEAAFSVAAYDANTLVDFLPRQALAKFRLF